MKIKMKTFPFTLIVLVCATLISSIIASLADDDPQASLGRWTWRNPLPHEHTTYGLAFGGGRFVAVTGQSGMVLVSSNGVEWTTQLIPTYSGMVGITYVGGMFVTVGGNGTILTSSDATTWTIRQSGTTAHLAAVTSNGNLLVAVGEEGAVVTSTNGIAWTVRQSQVTGSLWAVAFANGRFVATGYTDPFMEDAQSIISTDGINWTISGIGAGSRVNGLTFGSGGFVGVGENGTIVSTPDGVSWTTRVSPTTQRLHTIMYANGQYIAVGGGLYFAQPGVILTSPDGINWTQQNAAGSNGIEAIAFGGGIIVAAGDLGVLLTSTNGTTWVNHQSGFQIDLYGITFGGGKFVAVGAYGLIMTSADGATWSSSFVGTHHSAVVYGGGLFVTVGAGGEILVSSNAVTWTPRNSGTSILLLGVTYGNGRFVAVSDYDNTNAPTYPSVVVSSSDGVTWRVDPSNAGSFGTLNGVAFGNGRFVAVGQGEAEGGVVKIVSSTNGITWQKENPGTNTVLYGITFAQGMFIAVGVVTLVSVDGRTWTHRDTNAGLKSLAAIAFGEGRLLAVGDGLNGPVQDLGSMNLFSLDTVTWQARRSGTTLSMKGVAFGRGTFVTVGSLGAILQSDVLAAPGLQAQVSGKNFILAWPTNAPGYVLQTTTNLTATNSWIAVTNTPATVNQQSVVTNQISGAARFYRLKQ
jgi:hypothetical protein